MATNEVSLLMTVKDMASAALKKISGAAGDMQKNFKQLAQEVPGLGRAMELATNPIMLAGASIAAAGKFAMDATKQTVAYTKTVRDLAQNLDITTEETSRLIQTADDYGISVGQVEVAMKMALKNGFAPSIDTLAEMADAYNNINDPTERAAKLTKVFGRNWAELTPMLKEGGDAIREAARSQADNLIVTEESAKAARDYEKAVDALGDTWQGFKYQVGNELIPVLTAEMNKINEVQTAVNDMRQAEELGILTGFKKIDVLYLMDKTSQKYKDAVEEVRLKLAEYEASVGSSMDVGAKFADQLNGETTPALYDASDATADVNEAMKGYTAQLLFAKAAEGLTADAALILAQQLGLVDQRTVFATQRLAELKTAFDRNKDGMIDADEAARGYTAAVAGLDATLRGLPSNIPIDIYINTHGSVPDNLPAVTVPSQSSTATTTQKTQPQSYATGADFIVPAKYTNDSYPMNVSAGEHVTVTPKGGTPPGNRELIDAILSTRLNEVKLAKLIRDAVLQAM